MYIITSNIKQKSQTNSYHYSIKCWWGDHITCNSSVVICTLVLGVAVVATRCWVGGMFCDKGCTTAALFVELICSCGLLCSCSNGL